MFDYACNTWYPNLNKDIKTRLQAAQNECIRFYLKLGDRKSVTIKEFEKINWLPIHESVNQCILSCIYKFHAKKALDYMDEFFSHAERNGIPFMLLLSKTKAPSSQNKSRLKSFIIYWSLIME